MIIECISDLHGFYPELEGGDLLIIAGDVTNNDREYPFCFFVEEAPYEKIIWIGGNHDNIWYKSWLEHGEKRRPYMKEGKWKGPERNQKIEYLCDNGTIFKGLRIWGSPWTKTFQGINPKCKAFTVETEEELSKKWDMIPGNTDILITHSPPYGILDVTSDGEGVGSVSLRNMVLSSRFPKLRLHCFGHIHECGGKKFDTTLTTFVNASYVNERYQPKNKIVQVLLD